MLRHLPLLVSLSFLSTVAGTQDVRAQGHRGTAQQQRACRPDILRLCRDVPDKSDDALADCLKANTAKLSPACRQVLEGGENKR